MFSRFPFSRKALSKCITIVAATAALGSTLVSAQDDRASVAAEDRVRGPKLVTLQVLAFNDYHGHVKGDASYSYGNPAAGGGEYLSAKLQQLREGHQYSVTVAAGDLVGASPAFSGLFHDEPSIESLNAMGLDAASVGNHEFDEGVDELLRKQYGGCHPEDGCYFEGVPFEGAEFQYLAANVVEDRTGKSVLPEYWITKVRGIPVAFIGMTLEGTPELVDAGGIEGYRFEDEIKTANRLAHELTRQGVKAIVVLVHEGGIPETFDVDGCAGLSGPIIAINEGLHSQIDAIITGHTHQPYNCRLKDPRGRDRIVTSAYQYGNVVTELELVLQTGPRSRDIDRARSMAVNHWVLHDELTPDPEITAIIDDWEPLFAEQANTIVGSITADILRGGDPSGSDRGVESAAGNLVADAQLWATRGAGAQLALMNPGGLRSDLLFASSGEEGDGNVTFAEAFTFQPFNNQLVTLTMTGEQIVSVLEEQCQPAGSSRPILHLGVSDGFTYDLSTTVDAGNCTAVEISNVMIDGVALDMAASYRVTVNNFLANGGDNFNTLGEVSKRDATVGGIDVDALAHYLGSTGPVEPPSTDRVNELN